MTRGKLVLIAEGKRLFFSTEFNGDMSIDRDHGEDILKEFTSDNIHSIEDYQKYVRKFNNKNFHYDDDPLTYEATYEGDCGVCDRNWRCADCPKNWENGDKTCNCSWDLSGCKDLFDITQYRYYSDYMYWLNLSGEDVEVKTANGIVNIVADGGAVFNFDEFVETVWDSGFISADESYDYEDDAAIFELMKTAWDFTKEEATQIVTMLNYTKRHIAIVFASYEDVAEHWLDEYDEIPEYIQAYINKEDYGRDIVNREDDLFELESGRIIVVNED